MLLPITRAHRIIIAATAATLALTTTALAAHPSAGKRYAGFDSLTPIGKFRAPVSFKVNDAGTKLRAFKYSSLGCFGAGGFGNTDPYTSRFAIHKLGAIKVSKAGTFSVAAVKSTFSTSAGQIITTSDVSGQFTTYKKATGTISFRQKDVPRHGKSSHCTGIQITFTATRK